RHSRYRSRAFHTFCGERARRIGLTGRRVLRIAVTKEIEFHGLFQGRSYHNHRMARYAAVDIGSNSVRLEVAEVIGGNAPRILASERQVTRLGTSVFREGRIGADALDALCGMLASMAVIWKRHDVLSIRAVATAAVRDARNQAEFLTRTSAALGADIEIISGQEEARLIHLGVASRWPHENERFLIIDIGGGSAEFILSEGQHVRAAFSKPLGALRLQELFLKNDPPTAAEVHRLEQY